MEPKDGGPAYPVSTWNNDTESREVMGGMSLRDHFAGLAMQGAMVNVTGLGRISADARAKNLAEAAALFYEVADAMLAERERGR
jgi:hypothetical protein